MYSLLTMPWLTLRDPAAGKGPPRRRPAFRRLRLEALEDRTVPSNLTAANVSQLIADINYANSHPGSYTIALTAPTTSPYVLTAAQNTTDGGNGLPVIAAGGRLTIAGNGDTIARSTAAGTPAFRLFDVAAGAALSLENLTVAGGLATAPTETGPFGPVVLGGGILNRGARLTLSDVTLDNNQVGAPDNTNAAGGGIASVFGATLAVRHSTFLDNRAVGPAAGAGDSFGGGIFNDEGSALTVTQSTFTGNQATGGGIHGSFGGAIANAGGSRATVSQSGFAANLARGRDGADGGPGQSGATATDGGGSAIVSLSNGLLGAPAGATLAVTSSTFTGNQALGGKGGNGGAGGDGGTGGQGEGAVFTILAGSSTTVTGSLFTDNQSFGGRGGDGGDGGRGGGGGEAFASVEIASGTLLTVTSSTFTDNEALGGAGGNGVAGVNSGPGGGGGGGAISSGTEVISPEDLPTLRVSHSTFIDNRAVGGAGGSGGGIGIGGGINAAAGTMNVNDSTFIGNQAIGGAGANGVGLAGLAVGGGIVCGTPFSPNSTGFVTDCTLVGNVARGGPGTPGSGGGSAFGGGIVNGIGALTVTGTTLFANQAVGGVGGTNGNGGDGLGGGLFNLGAATVIESIIVSNAAVGGAAGSGGHPGNALGGGVFNDVFTGATISIDALTVLFGNKPDDCFGC